MKSLTPMQAASGLAGNRLSLWAALLLIYTPNLTDLFMTVHAFNKP